MYKKGRAERLAKKERRPQRCSDWTRRQEGVDTESYCGTQQPTGAARFVIRVSLVAPSSKYGRSKGARFCT